MKLTKKQTSILLVLLFVLVSAGVSYISGDKDAFTNLLSQDTPTPTASVLQESVVSSEGGELLTVTRVVDGDTIVLSTGQTVRYIGIDTPETVDPRREVGCFGKEASDKNKTLVLGKEVRLEKDISDTDRYGRLLRYVFVNGQMVNELLVREGYAHASSYPPDVTYQELFIEAEKEARDQGKGLWSKC